MNCTELTTMYNSILVVCVMNLNIPISQQSRVCYVWGG